MGRGPERLLEAGAEQVLGSGGREVSSDVVELDWDFNERSGSGEDDACFELMGKVSERVAAARADGAFPVILSGSCFAGGRRRRRASVSPHPGVVWLDAHRDFNSPETTLEGYLDGMGLAMLTGGAWQRMVAGVPGAKPVPETAALLVGARDFDEPEKRRLDESAVRLVGPGELRSPEALLAAIEGLEPAPSGLYLHVDLDVLDEAEGRVNVYSAADGVSAAELIELVGAVLDRHPVRALTLSAYDPDHDPEGRIPPVAMLVLGALAERVGPA